MNKEQARARLGKITASRFCDVMGSRACWISYARDIRGEIELLRTGDDELINVYIDGSPKSASLAWGHKYEDVARAEYELRYDVDVIVPGFRENIFLPYVGGSPDGLVNDRNLEGAGGLEIKAPYSEAVHINTIANGMPDEHIPQVQGNIWINDLAWMDFISFDCRRLNGSDYYEQRIPRDDDYIVRLDLRISEFWKYVMSGADDPPAEAFEGISEFSLDNLPALF